jgi:tetratricopeptide (TPR) repeat protein
VQPRAHGIAGLLRTSAEAAARALGLSFSKRRGKSTSETTVLLTPATASSDYLRPQAASARVALDFSQVSPIDPRDVQKAAGYRSYDADRPPETITWVGRAEHLGLLQAWASGVVTITGIGGQGKSALASKALAQWRQSAQQFWDWRDCREEGDRLPTQLASILSRVTRDELDVSALASASTADICRLFFRLLQDADGVLVFDNVDHYVDADNDVFTGPLHLFVQEALRSRTRLKIVLTCRPRVSYPDITFREIPLQGFAEQEALTLFRERRISAHQISDDQLREIHRLTKGHPFWLTMLAAELERKPTIINEVIAQLRAGEREDNHIVAMLRPVWTTLHDRERTILSVLSECSRPHSEFGIEKLVWPQIAPGNQFRRPLRFLVSLGLVIKKSLGAEEPLYELHPVVRGYLRSQFGIRERQPFLKMIVDSTRDYLVQVSRAQVFMGLKIETYEMATQHVEALIQGGQSGEAAKAALALSDRFVARGLLQEYIRIGAEIVASFAWDHLTNPDAGEAHAFIRDLVIRFVEGNREADARKLIDAYQPHLHANTSFRIGWYSALCRMEWLLGNYDEAVRFGRMGVSLKTSSSVDTDADAGPSLYLAVRDAGHPEEALKYYVGGADPSTLLNRSLSADPRGHSFYGNVGRCLYLLGKHDLAKRFYARSWQMIERNHDATSVENGGWAALWFGEAFLAAGQFDRAATFLAHARDVWSSRLPMKLVVVEQVIGRLPDIRLVPPAEKSGETALSCEAIVRDVSSHDAN